MDHPKITTVRLTAPTEVEGIDHPVQELRFPDAKSHADEAGTLHIHNVSGTIASFAAGEWQLSTVARFRPEGDTVGVLL